MKSYISFLLVCLLAFQTVNVQGAKSHLDARLVDAGESRVPHQQALQVLFNLPSIITGFLEYQDTQHALTELYEYFLSERLFKNLLRDFFQFMDTDNDGVITLQQYQATMKEANIDLDKANRVYNLAALDNPSKQLGFGDFCIAMELLFDESISQVSFAYLLGGPEDAEGVGIDHQTLVTGIQKIFRKLPDEYPEPGCDQLEYLFKEFDRDEDKLLNSKEFFHVLSIFLRYYKSGLDNFNYAKLVHRDGLFGLLWQKEKSTLGQVSRVKTLTENLDDLFQMAVFEQILNSVAHDIFLIIDENKNGVIEFEEFQTAMALFNAPESDARLLYTSADADESGALDFGEFLTVFETFVRRALSSVAFNFLKADGSDITLEICSGLWRDLAQKFNADIGLTDAAFATLFASYDVDNSGTLDSSEFTQFTSIMITSIKKTLRTNLDVKISVVSSLNATEKTMDQIEEVKLTNQVESNTKVQVAEGIVSRVLSWGSVSKSSYAATTITTTTTSSSGDEQEDIEGSSFLDTGVPVGSGGFGFSLYDAVRQAVQSNVQGDLPHESAFGIDTPANVQILLQAQFRNIPKFEI